MTTSKSKFSEALDLTFKEFGINAKALAERSGVTPQTISNYRRGTRDMTTGLLEKILAELGDNEREYFYKALGVPYGDVWSQLDDMSTQQLSELIAKVAERIAEVGQKQLQKV